MAGDLIRLDRRGDLVGYVPGAKAYAPDQPVRVGRGDQFDVKGGPGSGHWGHAGRPGQVGGSLPRDVAVSRTTGRNWRERQLSARYADQVRRGERLPVRTVAHVLAVRGYEDRISRNSYESFGAFDDEGNQVFTKTGDESTIWFTDADQEHLGKRAAGLVVTHNHPSNSSFSVEDIVFTLELGFAEMRAVARNGTRYRLLPAKYDDQMRPLWPDRAHFIDKYRAFNDALKKEFWKEIGNDRMTPQEASAKHNHELWTRLSAAYPDYFIYIRETP